MSYMRSTTFHQLKIWILIFPNVRILGTHHCRKELHEAFKYQGSFQDVLCSRYSPEPVAENFENQSQSEYYGGNRSISISVIVLKQYKQSHQTQIGCEPGKPTINPVFNSLISYDSKQYATTTAGHSKRRIEFLKQSKIMFTYISTVWEINNGCAN